MFPNSNRREALEAWMKSKSAKPTTWGLAPTERSPSPSVRKPMMPIQNGDSRRIMNQTNPGTFFGSGKKSVEPRSICSESPSLYRSSTKMKVED